MRTHRMIVPLALIVAGIAVTATGVGAAGTQRAGIPPDGAVPQGERSDDRVDLTSSGCLVCHGAPSIAAQGSGLHIERGTFDGPAHADLGCISCHPTLTPVIHAHPESERAAARASCGGCHREAAAAVTRGAHSPSSADAAKVPGCVTCHDAHGTRPAGSRAFIAAVATECSGCHTERGESFFDGNYHGKETSLGREDVAVCSDCHGAHAVLPADDPRSTIGAPNLLSTCRGCHRSVPPNFADIVIHVDGAPLPADGRLRLVTLYMTVLLVVTFALFGAHTVLSIRHAWRLARRGVPA